MLQHVIINYASVLADIVKILIIGVLTETARRHAKNIVKDYSLDVGLNHDFNPRQTYDGPFHERLKN